MTSRRRGPPRLYHLCLKTVSQILLTETNVIHGNHGENAKVMMAEREFLSRNLPLSIQYDLLNWSEETIGAFNNHPPLIYKWVNLLELFDPKQIFKNTVDLLRVGKRITFTVDDCDKLHNLLIRSSPKNLTHFKIKVESDELTHSNLPNILARAHSLTKVILHRGATNHILRILGMNCPKLTHLDISHSTQVTYQGLRNLLLRRPFRVENVERTKCADTIQEIVMQSVSINRADRLKILDILKKSYICHNRIICMSHIKPVDYEVEFNPVAMTCGDPCSLSDQIKAAIFTIARHVVTPLYFGDDTLFKRKFLLDSYLIEKGNEKILRIFLRRSLHLVRMEIISNQVTSLRLHARGGDSETIAHLDLDVLGEHFPNLREFVGGIGKVWNRNGPFLPQLTYCVVDSVFTDSLCSFLYHAPSLETFDAYAYVQSPLDDPLECLNDDTLERCLLHNQGLLNNLITLTLYCENLTVKSLENLIKHCRKLKSIGNVDWWSVNRQELNDFLRTVKKTYDYSKYI